MVAVPIGSDEASLFAKPPAGSMNTNKWTVTSQLKKGSDIGMGAGLADQDYATFTYDCISSTDYLINYNLVFGVFGAVDSMVGDAQVMPSRRTPAPAATRPPSRPRSASFPVQQGRGRSST